MASNVKFTHFNSFPNKRKHVLEGVVFSVVAVYYVAHCNVSRLISNEDLRCYTPFVF
jgi:hypothetical protein